MANNTKTENVRKISSLWRTFSSGLLAGTESVSYYVTSKCGTYMFMYSQHLPVCSYCNFQTHALALKISFKADMQTQLDCTIVEY
jgi:hypothetical protein